jgi:hypothetical protein
MSTFGTVPRRPAPAVRARVAIYACALLACLVLVCLVRPPAVSAAPVWARTWKPRTGNYTIYQARLTGAPHGGVYVGTTPCSATHVMSGIAVARYTPGGVRLWGKLLTKVGGSALAAVATAPSGGLVVAGVGPSASGATQWRLFRLDPSGKVLWQARLGGLGRGDFGPSALTVDQAGHIYVCGSVERLATGSDIALVKFGANGKRLWMRCFDGGAHLDDIGTALARAPQGDLYVAGHVATAGSGFDVVVARYSPTGHRVWRRIWDNAVTHGDDNGWAVAASDAGVVVTGSTDGAWNATYSTWDRDGLVVTYSPIGDVQYEYRVPGGAAWGELDGAYIDAAGNVAASGTISTAPAVVGPDKAVLLLLAPAGTLWHCSWLPVGPDGGGFEALTSRSGTLIAAGFEDVAVGGSNMLLHTVTPGLVTTIDSYSSGAGTTNDATAVLCRGSAIYVAGEAGVDMGLVRF